jgi:hypothetical protein
MALAVLAAGCLAAGSGLGGCEGGTSSETVGFVEAVPGSGGISGRADAGIAVSLYAADFQPHLDLGYADTVTADREGAFAFAGLEPGSYRLFARRPSDGHAAMISDLVIPPASDGMRRAALEPTGTLSGSITDDTAAYLGWVHAPGTPFFGTGDNRMRYALTGLPPGTYRVVKDWRRVMPCDSVALCGGIETRRDSADVGILPGSAAIW